MAPTEANWDETSFQAVQSSCSRAAQPCRSSSRLQTPRAQPEHQTASYAQLLLLHQPGWPNNRVWEQWQAAHPPGSLAMFVHVKAGVQLSAGTPGHSSIKWYRLLTSVDGCWGDISLVEAQLHSIAEVLQRCPHVKHIGLGSGHDVPVRLIEPRLLPTGVSVFGSYKFGSVELHTIRAAVVEDLQEDAGLTLQQAQAWCNALTFHHQLMVLSREHAAALLRHADELLQVGRVVHQACCSVGTDMAPDEFMMITTLRRFGYVRDMRRVQLKPGMHHPPGSLLNSYPTFVLFPTKNSPHPVLWSSLQDKHVCEVETEHGSSYSRELTLRGSLHLAATSSALFFRKIDIPQRATSAMSSLLDCLTALWLPDGSQAGPAAAAKGGRSSTRRRGRFNAKRRSRRHQLLPNCAVRQASQETGTASNTSATIAFDTGC